MPKPIVVNISDGIMCSREPRPLDSVGLYVPGGSAPLVSTLMMLAVPAKLAGIDKIIITTPPQKNGLVAPALLACAYLCGVEEIYCVGGGAGHCRSGIWHRNHPKSGKDIWPRQRLCQRGQSTGFRAKLAAPPLIFPPAQAR